MKKINKLFALLLTALVGLSVVACDDDDLNTDQYAGGVSLNVYGPQPVMRGGQLRFLGSNLDKIREVQIPGVAPITDIEVIKAGNPSEIRITVPHDGPEPGFLTLVTSDGKEIITKTALTYLEPIEVETLTPSPVKPGSVLTIKGDYLNLIKMVVLPDDVEIGEADFTAHSRYELSFVVPAVAKSGRVSLIDTDLTLLDDEERKEAEYNEIKTDPVEVTLPTVTALANLTGKKPGETVTQAGKDLDLVKTVRMASGTEVDFTVNAAGTEITYTISDDAQDGIIVALPASGVEVQIATMGMAFPEELAAAPATGLKAGTEVVITGKNLEVVDKVAFATISGTEEVEITSQSATEIKVTTPDAAVSGAITLICKSGLTVSVDVETAKPALSAYSPVPVSAGSELTISGQNLETVAKVTFSDLDVTEFAEQSEEKIVLTVPVTAVSTVLTITMKNGETVEFDQIEIDSPVFCFIPVLPGADVELHAGDLMQVNVVNQDVLINVQVDGKDVQYILVGDVLYVGLPETAGFSSKLKLISSNGEVEYDLSVIPNTEQTFVIWTGAVDLGTWSINWQFGDNTNSTGESAAAFVDMGLQAGDIIRVWATNYNDWWQIQFFDGHWGGQTEIGVATGLNNGNNINAKIYDLSVGYIEIPVTATLAEQLTTLNDWGYCWIIQGENIIISKIDVVRHISLETTLWEGEAVADDWGNQPYLLSDGGAELAEAGAKAGQTIRFYITPMADEWELQIVEGHWGPMYSSFKYDSWDLAANKGAVSMVLTEEMLTAAYTQQWWGGTFIANGDKVIVTKITIE